MAEKEKEKEKRSGFVGNAPPPLDPTEIRKAKKFSFLDRARIALTGKAPDNYFTASWRNVPAETALTQQKEQIFDLWRSEEYWRMVAKRYLPDLGLGFTTSPYVGPWEYVWGVTPVEDYAKYKEIFVRDPYVHAAITLMVQLTVSKGFQLFSNRPEGKEIISYLENWCNQHDILEILRIVVTDMLVFGNAYLEVIRLFSCVEKDFQDDRLEEAQKHQEATGHKINSQITWLKPLPAETMRVNRDPWGSVLGFVQMLTFPPVHFLPSEIIFFKYEAKSWNFESAYGLSILRSLLRIEALIKEFEDVIGQAMWSYNFPKFIVEVGVEGKPPPTDSQMQEVMDSFAARGPGTDIFVRHGDMLKDVKVLEPPTAPLAASEWWLTYLTKNRAAALGVPEFFLGTVTGNRAAVDVISQEFVSRLTVIQNILSKKLMRELFPSLIEDKFGEVKIIPEIVWNPIFDEPSDLKIAKAVQLFESGLVPLDEARLIVGKPALDKEIYGDFGLTFSPKAYGVTTQNQSSQPLVGLESSQPTTSAQPNALSQSTQNNQRTALNDVSMWRKKHESDDDEPPEFLTREEFKEYLNNLKKRNMFPKIKGEE